jgi:hypothetical protein
MKVLWKEHTVVSRHKPIRTHLKMNTVACLKKKGSRKGQGNGLMPLTSLTKQNLKRWNSLWRNWGQQNWRRFHYKSTLRTQTRPKPMSFSERKKVVSLDGSLKSTVLHNCNSMITMSVLTWVTIVNNNDKHFELIYLNDNFWFI